MIIRPRKKEATGKTAMVSDSPSSPAVETPFAAGSPVPASADGLAGLSERRLVFGICIFLAAIVWLVFGQTVHFAFINYDDNLYVYENPDVTGGLSLDGVKRAFTHTVASNWHPLTMLSHMLDWRLYGEHAGGHHLTNILLHTAAVIFLFLALRQMTGKLWQSALTAAVFAIHPLRAASVAWVSERKDVLSGVFFMLTLWAYACYARRPFSLGRYLRVAALFALGLLSKPMLITLPFVLLLLDYWPLGRFQWATLRATSHALRPLIWEKIPLFLLAAVVGFVTFVTQKNTGAVLEDVPAAARFLNGIGSYGTYVWEMVWPRHLAAYYPLMPSVPIWPVIGAGVLMLTVTALAIGTARRRAYILVGWLWYLGMLVPVIGFVQAGSQSHADRYTYLPQIGLYLLMTWGAADLFARWHLRRLVLGGVSATMLIALIFCARAQTSIWQNSVSLWTHTLAYTADNALAHSDLGTALLHAGQPDEAIIQFRQALQISPHYDLAHNDLGTALLHTGRPDEAMVQFQQAIQINPRFALAHVNLGTALLQVGREDEARDQFQQALQMDPRSSEAHYNLGTVLLHAGRESEAIDQFRQALQINPRYADAHNNLGYVFLLMGRVDEAVNEFQQALQIHPDDADAHNNLGSALLLMDHLQEATVQFQQALQINPGDAGAQFNLGYVLVRMGRADEAMAHYNLALQINPGSVKILAGLAWVLATASPAAVRNGRQAVELAERANQIAGVEDPILLRTLASACAEDGRFDDAVRNAKKARELAQAAGQSDLVRQLDGQLKFYMAKQPFHQEGNRFEN